MHMQTIETSHELIIEIFLTTRIITIEVCSVSDVPWKGLPQYYTHETERFLSVGGSARRKVELGR